MVAARTARVLSLLLGPGIVAQAAIARQHVWQADLQIRSLSVSALNGNLIARVVVAAEVGEALAARVEVMLPVGVGIVHLSAGCAPGPSAPGVPSLRARVICTIGNLRPRDSREFSVTTTTPPDGMARQFGVMASSDTPDPKPGNNFAERVIP
jgi:hypothetical protein